MRITIPVTIDVEFDLEMDGQLMDEGVIRSDDVGRALGGVIHAALERDHVFDELVEIATEAGDWCVKSLSVTTGDPSKA